MRIWLYEPTITICFTVSLNITHCIVSGNICAQSKALQTTFLDFPIFQIHCHCCVIMNEEDLGYLFLFGDLVITNMWKTSVTFLTHLDFPLLAAKYVKLSIFNQGISQLHWTVTVRVYIYVRQHFH